MQVDIDISIIGQALLVIAGGIGACFLGILLCNIIEWLYYEFLIYQFRKRFFVYNEYVSRTEKTLNPYNKYALVTALGIKQNVSGVWYIKYQDHMNNDYSTSLKQFIKSYRIYKLGQCAPEKLKQSIYQTD